MNRYNDCRRYDDCDYRNDIGECPDDCNQFKHKDDVRVVRFKDCAWARKVDNREPMFRCVNICRDGCTQWLDSNDFCSYGERRSE